MSPPDDYGWAYIDPQRASASADGPETSVQFRYGADSLIPGKFSGSNDLTFQPNDLTNQGGPGSGSVLTVTGALYVSGTIYADNYTIREITSTQIAHSGSTTFGNSNDDQHMTSGSLWVSREISGSEALHVQSSSSFGDYMTFHHTITGAADAAGGSVTGDGDVHVNKAILNDLRVSGSSIKGADANTTHQITGSLEVSNTAVFSANVQAAEYIYHHGDLNTFIRFQADDINIQAGGVDFIKITEDGSQDITVFNEAGADVDFRVESDNQTGSIFVDAASDMVHIQGDAFSFDGDGVLRIRPGTSNKGRLILQSRDTTAADAPQMDFQHYTDGTLAEGDFLGEIYFRGSEDEDGTYYAGAAIAARVDEAAWTDGSSAAGNLSFYTTPDGSTSLSKRVEIGSDGTMEITGALEVSTNVMVSGELHTSEGIRHLGDTDTTVSMGTDYVSIYAGNVLMLTATEDNSQDNITINPANADVDFIVDGDTNEKVFHVQAAAEGSGPAEMVHISGTLGPVSGSGEIHAAKFVGNNAEFSGSLSIHNIGDGARPGLTTLSISNSGSTAAITLTGGMTASHDVHVEHLYTNDLYVSGTAYGITVDRANYASASDPGTTRTYSPTGFETSGYLYVSGSTILGDVGATSHQVTGSFEVSGPAHFSDEVHAEGIFSADGHARLGNGPTDVVTFYNTITGSGDDGSNPQSSIFASHVYAWALNTSGSSVLGSAAEDTHQVTGSLEVSNTAVFSANVQASEYIYHQGDLNTFIRFQADDIDIQAGGVDFIKITEDGSQDLVRINPANADVDFVVSTTQSSGSLKIDGDTGDIHIGGDQVVFDYDECTLRIRPHNTTDQAKILLHSKDTTAADEAQLQFLRYTDGTFADGDNLGTVQFKGAEDEDGTYYTAASIVGEVDEAGWADGSSAAGRLLFYTTADGATTGTKRMEIGSDGAVEITGSFEVSGPAHFTDEVHAEAALNVDGALTAASTAQIDGLLTATGGAVLGNASGDTHQVTGSFEVSGPSNFTSVVNAEGPLFVYGLLTATGNAVLGNHANDTHQVTGSLEVSGPSNFTSATAHEAGLTSTTISGSSTLSALGGAHLGGTLTMDGAGIVFNVDTNAGTVNLQVNDGAGADTAITLGKNGKVTKIGDDTPSDGQVLSWDALGGKVAWSDGTTPDMSGSDNHYTSTEFRTSGQLKVSGSSTLAGGITANGHATFNEAGADVNFRVETSVASGSFKIDGGTGDIHLGGDTVTYDHSEGSILIRPGTTDQGTLILASRDGTSADDAQLDFRRYTDGSFASGDNLGIIQFKGAETEDGTYYPAAAIMAEVDEALWSDGVSTAGRLKFFTTPDSATTLSTALMIDAEQSATFYGDVVVVGDIRHSGDTDTKIAFTTDEINFTAGNVNFLQLDETTQDIARFNPANADVDFQVSTSATSGSLKIDGATGDIHMCGDTFTFDQSEGVMRIRPGTTKQGTIMLHSRDATAADEAQLQFLRYTDGSLTTGDNLGIIQFKGSNDEDGTYYTAASIVAEVDESTWVDGSSCAGRLLFYTTRDGDIVGTERLRIDDLGIITIDHGKITSANNVEIESSAGDVILDAAGGDILFKNGSTTKGSLDSSGNLQIDGRLEVGLAGTARSYIQNVGVGATQACLMLQHLHVNQDAASKVLLLLNFQQQDDTYDFDGSENFIMFSDGDDSILGDVDGEISYNTFTGAHISTADYWDETWEIGMIVESTGEEIIDEANLNAKTLNMSDALVKVKLTTGQKSKSVIGVYKRASFDGEDKRKHFELGARVVRYNAIGEGRVLVTDTNGNIDNGDYICSSTRTGLGEKQDDDLLHSYTVAKATVSVNWDDVTPDDSGVKKKLIACTYHCG